MFSHQLKLALRSMRRHLPSYIISTGGLLLGCTVFMLLACYVYPFLTFDQHFKQHERIARLNTLIQTPEQSNQYAASSFPIGPDIARYYPEIKSQVRIRSMATDIEYDNQPLDESFTLFADSNFFEVFDHRVLAGSLDDFRKDPLSIVITEEIAQKYFKDINPLGQFFQIPQLGDNENLQIKAIVENPRENSSMQFTTVAHIRQMASGFGPTYASLAPGLSTFFLLHEGLSIQEVSDRLEAFRNSQVPEGLKDVMQFELQPIDQLHFSNDYLFDIGRKGSYGTLVGLLSLGFLTLLIAVINYVNISTALGIKRAKDIAVRKVLGSSKNDIARLYFFEATITLSIVILLALSITFYSLGKVSEWIEFDLVVGSIPFQKILYIFSFLLLSLIVLTASYPAFYLSKIRPVDLFKKEFKLYGSTWDLKKILTSFQFAITICFMLGATIIYDQLNFLKNRDLGFDQDQVLIVNTQGNEIWDRITEIKSTIDQLPATISSSVSMSGIQGQHTQANFSLPDDTTDFALLMEINHVDFDFIKTYGSELLAGRPFSQDVPNDVEGSFIINEAAAEELGYNANTDILEKRLMKTTRDTSYGQIIGVIANYHAHSLHQAISPMVWQVVPEGFKNVYAIRFSGPVKTALRQYEDAWNTMSLGAFDYQFLDEQVSEQYRNERQLSTFISVVSLILIIISSSGLYGMMLFYIEEKKTEIGIRKILGAGVEHLIFQLNRQHILLMSIGFVIGIPTALFFSNKWLTDFAYHVAPSWYHVVFALVTCIFVSFASISWLTWSATHREPAEVLREE